MLAGITGTYLLFFVISKKSDNFKGKKKTLINFSFLFNCDLLAREFNIPL